MKSKFNKKKVIEADIGDFPRKAPTERVELKGLRDPYSTRYLNPDSSFTKEIFLEPRYYQDLNNNQWQEIDNNLEVDPEDNGQFQNTANSFRAIFSKDLTKNSVASLEFEDTRLSLIPIRAKGCRGEVEGNRIDYNGIYSDTDISYYATGAGIKEEIVLKDYNTETPDTFSFELKLDGLEVLEEDNLIYLANQHQDKVWRFEAPYMVDGEGEYSDQVELNLTESNGRVYLNIIVDTEFLADNNRVYPVTIDPTINNWNVVKDTFVTSSFPNSSYSSLANLYTGNDPYYYGIMRSFIKFALPALASSAKITNASFSAYQTQADSTTSTIELYPITEPWVEDITWNSQPPIESEPVATEVNNSYNQYWQWDITELMIDWYNGEEANYGFMLKDQDEDNPFRRFQAVNSGSYTPRITIDYWIDPIGLERFWGYSKDGVNPVNGNLVLQQQDFKIPGRGAPLNLTRTYNSRKTAVAGIFGYGWTSNLETQLVDAGEGPITLIDGDGTRHIFGQEVGGGYQSPPGIYLDLEKNLDGTYVLTQQSDDTDKAKNKTYFNSQGRISSIVDSDGNTTSFNYQDNRLISIEDPSGRVATFNYNSNGLVTSIALPENRTISYDYDSANNLMAVTDPANNTITFAYNTIHKLTEITDQRDITTSISYDSANMVSTVSRPITSNGLTQTSTTTYSYDTFNNLTTVVDGEGRRIDYEYNSNGNIVTITKAPLDSELKAVKTFDYDNNNNLVEETTPKGNQDNIAASYVYAYDDNGNLIDLQLPENQLAQFAYDDNNNLIARSDFRGYEDYYLYDKNNNQTEDIDNILEAKAARYTPEGNLSYHTKVVSAADNLVLNPSFEHNNDSDSEPLYWDFEFVREEGDRESHTANPDWSTISKTGSRSVRISNPTTYVIYHSPLLSYPEGTDYALSGYIKTENVTNNAEIKLEYFNSQLEKQGEQIVYALNGTHDWTRIRRIIHANDMNYNTEYIRVAVGLGATDGTAYFDGIQLEFGSVVSSYNFIENAGYEWDLDEDGIPDNWTTSDNLLYNYDGIYTRSDEEDDKVYSGVNSFRLRGEEGKEKYIKQSIDIDGDENTKLTLSGWSKQVNANPNGGYYGLQLAIYYDDGEVDWSNANDFDASKEGWQHIVAEITPDKAFSQVEVYFYYYNQTGTAWFDAMRLEKNASITAYSYDEGKNYVTSITDPLDNTIFYDYDDLGNLTSYTDAKGNSTTYNYDLRNLLTEVVDPNSNQTLYDYDSAGNLVTVTDAKNNQSSYSYNEFNLLSSITNPLNQTISFEYDQVGNRTETTYPTGNQLSYAYNQLNRLIEVYYDGLKRWDFAYDRNGNLTTVSDLATTDTLIYSYDQNDRAVQQQEDANNIVNYGYNDNNQVIDIDMMVGSKQTNHSYFYNSLNQLIGIYYYYGYRAEFTYDERGNVSSVLCNNGSYTTFDYDAANRLQLVRNYSGNGEFFAPVGELLEEFEYSYDANGNRTSVTTTQGSVSYQYDELNRLVEETLLDGTVINYSYDSVGNRTEKSVTQNNVTTITNYTYNATNELIAVDNQEYIYDDNGNLINNGEYLFSYNANNRLIEVEDSSGTTIASYTYDYRGLRKSKTTTEGTINYHYDVQGRLIYETNQSGTMIADYTYDAQNNPVTMTRSGVTYYYHLNGHGDVIALSDENGQIVAEYEYDAWGNIISQSGTMAEMNPYRYAGYYYDEETGVYYLRARYYDAEIGRFIRRDTVQKINQYAYADNNPVMLMDSNGNWAITIPYANTYNFARNLLSIGAAAYLLPKNYDLSYELFNHGLFGNGQDLYFGQDSLLAQKVSQSNKFRNQLKKEIGNRSWFSFNSSIEFETGDLHYAIQHTSYNVWGYRHSSGKLKVYVSMGDIYDFTKWRKEINFSNLANNLGYVSQKTGVIDDYNWNANFIIYI